MLFIGFFNSFLPNMFHLFKYIYVPFKFFYYYHYSYLNYSKRSIQLKYFNHYYLKFLGNIKNKIFMGVIVNYKQYIFIPPRFRQKYFIKLIKQNQLFFYNFLFLVNKINRLEYYKDWLGYIYFYNINFILLNNLHQILYFLKKKITNNNIYFIFISNFFNLYLKFLISKKSIKKFKRKIFQKENSNKFLYNFFYV